MLLIALALQAAATSPMPRSGWQNPPHRGGMHGGINREQRFDRLFAMADTNHDGQLSKAELEAARAKMRAHREQHMRAGGWNGQSGWAQRSSPQR